LIPNIIISIPFMTLGLFTTTTFIRENLRTQVCADFPPVCGRQHRARQQDIPSNSTTTANAVISRRVGQKLETISPAPNAKAKTPRLWTWVRIVHSPNLSGVPNALPER
jgi:hypothetical protein